MGGWVQAERTASLEIVDYRRLGGVIGGRVPTSRGSDGAVARVVVRTVTFVKLPVFACLRGIA